MPKPKVGDRRFAICKYTKKMVEQEYEPDNTWLCLHEENE